jgi:hypothetical protein
LATGLQPEDGKGAKSIIFNDGGGGDRGGGGEAKSTQELNGQEQQVRRGKSMKKLGIS